MITLTIIFVFFILILVLSFFLHLAGGILKIALKLVFCLPCAILCGVLGLVCCCTLILIPLGILCFKLTGVLLSPLRACMI
ncbi:MAG: hypothetical protein K2N82_08245 [Lachnospiraceae bacterium]|nr:hypothetical protein [Lachnospiraceae bacterium]